MPPKRILLAIGLFFITIGLGVAIYFVFFRPSVAPPTPPPAIIIPPVTGLPLVGPGEPVPPIEEIPSTLPTVAKIAQGGPTETVPLTEQTAVAATLSDNGQSIAYYSQNDGRFYRIDPDSTAVQLSNEQFFNVQKVNWSPDTSRAVLEYPDGANILFDFDDGRQITLPKHWEDFSFSADGSQIAAKSMGVNTDNRWLIVSNADGSEARALEPLGNNAGRVSVNWSPSGETVAFSATGEALGFDTQEILLIGQNHENFKSLIAEGRDFRTTWSKDGNSLLYSVYSSQNGYRPMLWLVDARGETIGDNRRSIGLNTWADKCTFSSATVAYCAVPSELPEGYGFQPSLASNIPDNIYRIDIASGSRTLVGAPAEGISVNHVSVSSDERYLFFTDAQTGILRRMQLR